MVAINRGGFEFNPFVNPTVLSNGRVYIPTGNPVVMKRGSILSNPVRKIEEGFLSFAQIVIARTVSHDYGVVPVGHLFPVNQVSDEFKKIRRGQIPLESIGATFISQKGVFEGALDEESLQIIVYFFPVKREETLDVFKENILRISEFLTDFLSQKTANVNFYKKGIPDTAWEVTHS